MQAAWQRGLMLRVTADIIAFSPPLIAEQAHVEQMFAMTREVLAGIE